MRMVSVARWLVVVAIALVLMAVGAPAHAQNLNCQYVLGFAAIYNQIPDIVGPCRSNESYDANGNSNQYTANGMMQWRKADNFTAFTDGYRSWVNGPCGVEMRLNTQRFPWESNLERMPVVASACGSPVPPPPPPVRPQPPIAVLPTAAPPPPPPLIQFYVDDQWVRRGDCTTLHWRVANIDSVYLDGEGVTGEGDRQVCPSQETTYRLRVNLRDGRYEERTITIGVVAPK